MSYLCSVCGYKAIKPLGRCPNCGEWDTFVKEGEIKGRRKLEIKKLREVELSEGSRIDTGISVLNAVLGGGLFKGSVVLLGGNRESGNPPYSCRLPITSLKVVIRYYSYRRRNLFIRSGRGRKG